MSTTTTDLYEVLQVSRTASGDEIKQSYRRLAREHHPDVNAHRREESETLFKEVSSAYAVLSDPQKRATYDQYGHAGLNGGGMGGGADTGDLGDLFDIFFQGMGNSASAGVNFGGASREQTRRGADTRLDVTLTLQEAYAGVTRELKVPTMVSCGECEGSGAATGTSAQSCDACNGVGRVRQLRQTFFGQFVQEAVCARCGGTGRFIPNPCPKCAGEGRLRGQREVRVQIPAGVDEGDRVRVVGAGEEGRNGAPAGDLYCFIYIEPHREFERREHDVFYAAPISFSQASLGDRVAVPTLELDGEGKSVMEEIIVPAGTQNGTRFRLPNRGFTDRNNHRGSQICIAHIVVPKNLSERQKELMREFAELADEHPEEHGRGFFDRLKDAFV